MHSWYDIKFTAHHKRSRKKCSEIGIGYSERIRYFDIVNSSRWYNRHKTRALYG